MQVLFACLADLASAESQAGKLNVMGIFDAIYAQKFPAVQPKMFLVVRVLFEHEDNGKKRKLTIRLRDADHREFAKIDAEAQAGTIAPGDFGTTNLILELNGIGFAKPGRYHFAITADAGKEGRVPFAVRQV